VYYHGQTLTQDARQVDGRTYVPLADVARALGGRVASRGGGLEIVTGAGGAPGAGQTAQGGDRRGPGRDRQCRGLVLQRLLAFPRQLRGPPRHLRVAVLSA
jgi:hypothetical protein